MTEKPFGDIDELLMSWSTAQEPSQEHLDQLSAKVADSLAAPRDQSAPVQLRDRTSWYSSAKFLLSAAAVIAVIVSAASLIALRDGDTPEQIASLPASDPIEEISDAQRQQKQQLLAELDRMFDGKRVWFAETESEVVLGGDSKPTASEIAAQSTVAMRLVLAKRSSATTPWQRVWSADVVSRSDQVVQFLSKESQQPTASFTAWAHLLPDGLVACDVDLKWDDGQSGQLSDSLLLLPGDTQTGASLSVDGVEYQLFHTVSVLEKVTT